MKKIPAFSALISSIIASISLTVAGNSRAADLYWGGQTDANWATATNWWLDAAAMSGGVMPTSADIAHLYADTVINPVTSLGAARGLNGLVFNASASTGITLGTLNDFILSLGASGINVQSGSGAHTINSAVTLTAGQSWTNNSGNLFTVAGNLTTGATTLNIGGSKGFAITGNTTVSGAATINNNNSEALTLNTISLNNNLTLGGSTAIAVNGVTSLAANRVITVNNTAGVTFGGFNSTATATLSLNASSGTSAIVNGPISPTSGTLSVTLNNAVGSTGAITFNGANTFTGTLILVQGQLNINASNPTTASITFGATNTNGVGQTATINLGAGVNYRAGTITQQANSAGGIISGGAGSVISLNANRTLAIGKTSSTGADLIVGVGLINGDSDTARSITKTGIGTVQFDGANDFTGTVNLQEGTIIQNANQVRAGALTLGGLSATATPVLTINSGITYRLGGTVTLSALSNGGAINGSGALGLYADRAFVINDTAAADDLVVLASISNGDTTARFLRKELTGTMVMGGDNTYTGRTDVARGTVVADYDYTDTSNSKFDDAAIMKLRGGTLLLRGSSSVAISETVGSLNLNGFAAAGSTDTAMGGSSILALESRNGQALAINLGAITRSVGSGLVDFRTNNTGLATFTTTATNNLLGILGPYAAFNGNRFATVNAGNIEAVTSTVQGNRSLWTATDNIVVNSAPTGQLTATTINSLAITNAGDTTLNIDNNARTLHISSGGLLIGTDVGASNTTINASQLMTSRDNTATATTPTTTISEFVVQNRSTGNLTVNANIGSNNALLSTTQHVTYGGNGLITLTGNNNYTGNTGIQGNVKVSGGNALADYSLVNMGSGESSLNLDGSTEAIGALAGGNTTGIGAGEIMLGTDGTLIVNGSASATYSGIISGSGTFIKKGTSTQAFNNQAQTFTGTAHILGGILNFAGSGTGFSGVTDYYVRGGELRSTQDQSGTSDKLDNDATIHLQGTSGNGLFVTSNQAASRTETIAAIALDSGANTLTLNNSITGTTIAATTHTILNVAGAAPLTRSSGATLLLRGQFLGGTAVDDVSVATRLTFTNATPVSDAMIGTSTTAGEDNLKILPYALGENSITGVGDSFITLGANGLRTLDVSTEYATAYASGVSDNNLSLTTSTAAAASATYNSLRIDNTAGNINLAGAGGGSNTLSLTSGALLVVSGVNANDTTIGGYDQILAGTASDGKADELIVFTTTSNAAPTGAVTSINSIIANNGTDVTSLTKSGNGTLVLGAANTYTGATSINQGRVEFSNNANLGNGGVVRMAGGTLAWAAGNTTDISTRSVELVGPSSNFIPTELGSGAAGNSIVTGNTFDTGANNLTFANAIGVGGTGGLIKTGTGSLTLSAAPTYTGATVIMQGSMNFATVAANTTSGIYQNANAGTVSTTITNGIDTQSVMIGGNYGPLTANVTATFTVNGGSVNIGDGSQDDIFFVGYRDNSASGDFKTAATANLAAASSVDIDVNRVYIGYDADSASAANYEGDLTLSANGSNTVKASQIVVGNSRNNGSAAVTSTIILGNAENTFYTDNFTIAGQKAAATVGTSTSTTGTFVLRASDGVGGANVYIGDNDVAATNTVSNGQLLLNGKTVDAVINNLVLGRYAGGGSSTRGGKGTLSFDKGYIDATTIQLAVPAFRQANTTYTNITGTINQSGGAILRYKTLSSDVPAIVNDVPTTNANHNWQGGTIQNLANDNLTNVNVSVNLTQLGSESLTDPSLRKFTVDATQTATFQADARFTGAGSFTKDGDGELILQGTNTNTGNVHLADGSMSLQGNGVMNDAAWFNVGSGATFNVSGRSSSSYLSDAVISGTGLIKATGGTFTVGSNVGAINNTGVLKPGASSTNNSLANASTVGDLTGTLTIEGNLVLSGNLTRVDRAVLQLASSNRNAASSIGNYTTIASWVDNIDNDFASFMDDSGGNHDFIDVSGNLTLATGGGITVQALGYTGVGGDVFNLFDWTGPIDMTTFSVGDRFRNGTETGLDLILPTLSAGFQWDTSLFLSHGVLVVVPEPGRALFLLFAMVAALVRRRR